MDGDCPLLLGGLSSNLPSVLHCILKLTNKSIYYEVLSRKSLKDLFVYTWFNYRVVLQVRTFDNILRIHIQGNNVWSS